MLIHVRTIVLIIGIYNEWINSESWKAEAGRLRQAGFIYKSYIIAPNLL